MTTAASSTARTQGRWSGRLPRRTPGRDTGAQAIYLDPIAADETVLIDLADRTVLSGKANRRHRLAITDWDGLALPPRPRGVDYALAHNAPPNLRARLTVCWRSAWN